MNIKEMTGEEIEARLAEIKNEIPTADGEKLAELRSELEEIEARKNEARAQAEERERVAIDETLKVINEMPKEDRKMADFTVGSAEYRNAFLKNLSKKEVSVEERTALTNASAVIPTQTMNKIVGALGSNPLIAELNITHFPGYVSIPVADTVADASWTTIATASTDSADVVRAINLGAYKIIKTIEVTADIARMSIDAFEDWLVNALSIKMAKAICAGVLVGTGTNQATGVITSKTAVATGISYANILKAMAGVDSAYQADAVWVMPSATFFNDILGLVDNNGRPLVVQGAVGIDTKPTFALLGHKVVFDENATKIVYGDFGNGYAFNLGSDVEITSDASVEFRSGSIVYRAMAIGDGKVADAKAFAVLGISA